MQWKGRRQSTNVSDQRGSGGGFGGGGPMRIPVRAGGGGGIGLLIILAILWLGFGINPLALLGMDQGGGSGQGQVARGPGPQGTSDETDDFVATVLADTEDVWNRRFADAGETYPEPTLVMFSGSVSSACGQAAAAMGPFYCPLDQKVYIDLSFFRQLAGQLNSPGDFAQAYVIAHEVGHHVQNVTGILPRTTQMRRQMSQADANAVSVLVELQADCYAGIWAHDTYEAGYLEPGDIDEALNAASQIGDDTLQRRSQGTVVPDSFTHGTSEQRQQWFKRGYESGDMAACDTFEGRL
ncbi:zinc metallopeptidase [Aureimonas sp. OT7]|uniref:KPN_02809 family neutral zinc metallopeptidase n=1 Tax=Aureimonas TaxID=414371 RepID=UPI00177E86BA|nr:MULTISPECIES: neutral zinc metallopeptidase [Aureimonas]QOG08147.1 zinc metallopeptidase [Aureimonas sp. OT7]